MIMGMIIMMMILMMIVTVAVGGLCVSGHRLLPDPYWAAATCEPVAGCTWSR